MSDIIVTLKSNVEQDEQGEFILNEDGIPKLIDIDDIGILVKSHPIMTLKYNQESGEFESGYTTRAEVYWDMRRNPSPSLHRPADLVWMEFVDPNAEDDDLDPDEEEGHLDGEQDNVDADAEGADYEEDQQFEDHA